MKAVNPATGEAVREYPGHGPEEVARRLQQADRAFREWRRTSLQQRGALLLAVAQQLKQQRDKLSRQITQEMGKPIQQAEGEIDKCVWACEFYADSAERFLAPEEIRTELPHSFVRFDPLGPVLAIMPWNFPFWQFFRFAAPGLMAGNVALLKHAANVPGTALAIEQVFREAGYPDGVVATLLISSDQASGIIGDPTIRAVTLTGSPRAGRAVAAAAGKHLKKTVLELGGSDAFVVLADADLEQVAARAVEARLVNSGQSCIAAKRFIVEDSVAGRFEEAFVNAMERTAVGDPLDRRTEVGPMARADLRETLHEQVVQTERSGAKRLTGGRPLDRPGFFYAPTVLSQVEPGMVAFDEETFGPVAAVTRARDAAHAIELANRSQYGLGASIWTADSEHGERLAAEIQAGFVAVNGIVKSDPRLPFGGIKHSGYGRELGVYGIREFVNAKTVACHSGEPGPAG
jgi:succinate-semialdehyde dehydrogenase/glutarate-semialdehyde dehydrogenase